MLFVVMLISDVQVIIKFDIQVMSKSNFDVIRSNAYRFDIHKCQRQNLTLFIVVGTFDIFHQRQNLKLFVVVLTFDIHEMSTSKLDVIRSNFNI